ncbi:F5/8 type C domain-containing protein [Kineothrix alysoides]|uniref:F5/8 type C domain-containing protein n=1 Tax=Kineothrix alysoides TaxID=1469948 RepID=A0A4V2QBL3_9FIRM|nr:discoidin domain-containing protein [Kineothrix alysoides]TCL56882.1 F5/8 type C domain-containing protein [Kineothrix alysoides]
MKKGGIIALTLMLVSWAVLFIYDMRIGEKEAVKMPETNVTIVEAPEQSAPMEHEAFLKEEYISQVPEGDNLALEGKIEASGFADVYVPKKAIDGKTAGPSYWEGDGNSYPDILTLELAQTAGIHAVRVSLCPQKIWGKRTQEFAVRISEDGINYEELIPLQAYDFDPDRGNEAILNFEETDAKYIELEFTSNTGGAGAQVAEFEVYGSY